MLTSPVVAIIEARMRSSRFPGKVLSPLGGTPALAHLIARLRYCSFVDFIVVASTWNATDDVLAEFAKKHDVAIFRGSEQDVLGRLASLMSLIQPRFTVKVTGDCPLIDPVLIEQVFTVAQGSDADMVSNASIRSFPDGMDCTVLRGQPLTRAAELATDPLEREHPTLFLRRHPELFKIIDVEAPDALRWPSLGLTLDTPEDLRLLDHLVRHFSPPPFPSCGQIIRHVRENPQLLAINGHIPRLRIC